MQTEPQSGKEQGARYGGSQLRLGPSSQGASERDRMTAGVKNCTPDERDLEMVRVR